jgi:hypothetical protein
MFSWYYGVQIYEECSQCIRTCSYQQIRAYCYSMKLLSTYNCTCVTRYENVISEHPYGYNAHGLV